MKGGITSPVMGPNGLPVDGFGRGYGYGFQGMNGMGLQYAQGSPQAQGQTAGVYDPTAVPWTDKWSRTGRMRRRRSG